MTESTYPMTNALQIERHRRCRAAMMVHVSALISHGTPLYEIARQRGLPNLATLRRWLVENDDLRNTYEEARGLREEYAADDAVMLADALADAGNAGLRLRLDARKWRVALEREDGKGTETSAAKKAALKEKMDRWVRALERVRLREEEEFKQRQAARGEPSESFAAPEPPLRSAADDIT